MPGIYDQNTVLQIQQANDIVDVVAEHVSLKRKGREMVGLCPFHDDHSPSMNVSPSKQIFKCFACGAGGDVFKFVQMRENLTFPQAIERLAERVHIKLEPVRRARPAAESPGQEEIPDVDPNRLAKANGWAAEHFAANLQDETKGREARDYLARRQISPESIETWRIGLALGSGDDLLRAAREKKAPLDLLQQAGLLTAGRQDKFVNRLMFSITDVTGRLIAFGGRTLDDTGAKYINSPTTRLFDKSNSLFGLEQARHAIVSSGIAVVVEGYTDVIMAHQHGCTNVVATLGTSFTAGHGRILRRYAKKVILVFDSDVAGLEAANRALEVCLSQKMDIKIAAVPDGEDPCEFILDVGKEGFERLLDGAVDVLQFKWDRLTEKFATDDSLSGQRAALEEYLQAIAVGFSAGRISQVDAGFLRNRISSIVGLTGDEIKKELNIRIKRAGRAPEYGTEDQPGLPTVDFGQGLFAAAQREILEILLNEPRFYKGIKGKIKADDFGVPILRETATVLFAMLDSATDVPLDKLLASVESIEMSSCITELAQVGEEKGNFEPRLKDAMDLFERHLSDAGTTRPDDTAGEREYLRRCCENARKDNPHNIGMT
ncbi:MAG: DNA primase [Planctomycetota bacterium]|jgi:DNA primase